MSPSASSQPSSLDEQVPNLASASTGPPSESPLVMLSADTNQNLSSLNPSASRFSLSIPFLGRPKVPRDRAITPSPARDTQSETDTSPAPPTVVETETAPDATGEYSQHDACKQLERFCSREFRGGPCAAFRAECRARQ